MTANYPNIKSDLHAYMLDVSMREPDVLQRMRQETHQMENGGMLLSPEQGQFLAFLVKSIGAERAVEVGVFTGCSATWVAMAMPENGRIIACDVSEEYTSIARRYWQEADIAHKIDLRIAPASDTLDQLIDGGQAGQFDFAFIDADKVGYGRYYEQCLQLLRPGGLMAFDNMFRGGRVVDESYQDEDTNAIRALNKKAGQDERVDVSLVPIGDGVLIVRKR